MCRFPSEALYWQLLLCKFFLFNQSFPTPCVTSKRKETVRSKRSESE